MSLRSFLCLTVALCLTACAAGPPPKKEPAAADTVLPVDNISQDIFSELTRLGLAAPENGFSIVNTESQSHQERQLDRDFIEALIDSLVLKGIRASRKDIRHSKMMERDSDEMPCEEVLRALAANYLIQFSIRECPQKKGCLEVKAEGSASNSEMVLFSVAKTFRSSENMRTRFNTLIDIPFIRGSRQNPYEDYSDAAHYMFGKLHCIAKEKLAISAPMRFGIAKSADTPKEIAYSYDREISNFGFESIPYVEEWLSLDVDAHDRFKISQIPKSKKKNRHADIAVGIARKTGDESAVYRVKAGFIVMSNTSIVLRNRQRTLSPGASLPYCSDSVYVKAVSASTGSGTQSEEMILPHQDKTIMHHLLARVSEEHANELKSILKILYDLEISVQENRDVRDQTRIETIKQIEKLLAKVREIDVFIADSADITAKDRQKQRNTRVIIQNFQENFKLRIKNHVNRSIESLVQKYAESAERFGAYGTADGNLLKDLKETRNLLSQLIGLPEEFLDPGQKKMMDDVGNSIHMTIQDLEAALN